MSWSNWVAGFNSWFELYWVNLGWSLVFVLLYMLVTRLALPKIEEIVDRSKLRAEATQKAYHTVRLILGVVTLSVLLIVWGVDFSGLLLLSTSLLTLTGVAMFASWSLLSNVTSYFILLFHPAFRRGNFVRVIDMDNYIEGYIADVNLFNTRLLTEDREVLVYPNNMMLTRPTLINPRNRWRVMGKTTDRDVPVPQAAESIADKTGQMPVQAEEINTGKKA